MNLRRWVWVLVVTYMAAGCAQSRFFRSRQIRGYIVGAVAEGQNPQDFSFVNFEDILLAGKPLAKTPAVRAYELIEVQLHSQTSVLVDNVPEVKVEEGVTKLYEFQFLLGAKLGTGSVARAFLTADNPTNVFLESGWLLAWGWRPYFRSHLAITLTESTVIAMQIVSDNEERVYLIGDGKVKVSCNPDRPADPAHQTKTFEAADHFVTVKLDPSGKCTISDPALIPPLLEDEFVDPAKKQAAATASPP